MKNRSTRMLRRWLRDMALGAIIFLAVPAVALMQPSGRLPWRFTEANAGEVIATRAVDVTAPAGLTAENAIIAAGQMRASGSPVELTRMTRLILLGLTFSFLVSFNLAIFRHLRRVSTSSRREDWRERQ